MESWTRYQRVEEQRERERNDWIDIRMNSQADNLFKKIILWILFKSFVDIYFHTCRHCRDSQKIDFSK